MIDPPLPDGTLRGRCDRCLAPIIGRDREHLVEQGYELRDDEQVWCVACSRDARAVKRHDQRGHRRR